jgi:hypothetical protein
MEKEQLRQRVALLERKITEMERIRELRQTMQQLQAPGLDAKKNSRSCKPSSTKPPPPRPPLG